MCWWLWLPAWLVALLAVLLALYATLDLAYFVRMMLTVMRARYCKKKACILETTQVKSWCFINDVDTLLYHMNNARYLRELDFARVDFYERTGLYAEIRAAGGSVLQAASTIRYRRLLKPCTTFYITSKAVYFDERYIFMEHQFVGAGGFVHAVALCRQRVLDTSAAALAEGIARRHCAGDADAVCRALPLKMPLEVSLWVQANEVSSAKLRCRCTASVTGETGAPGSGEAKEDKPICTCTAAASS